MQCHGRAVNDEESSSSQPPQAPGGPCLEVLVRSQTSKVRMKKTIKSMLPFWTPIPWVSVLFALVVVLFFVCGFLF